MKLTIWYELNNVVTSLAQYTYVLMITCCMRPEPANAS